MKHITLCLVLLLSLNLSSLCSEQQNGNISRKTTIDKIIQILNQLPDITFEEFNQQYPDLSNISESLFKRTKQKREEALEWINAICAFRG